MKKKDMKNKKTIIIFTLYLDDELHYPSFVHSHAAQYVRNGYNVIVFAQKAVLPIVNLFVREKRYVIEGVNVIVGHRFSISGLFPNCAININGIFYYLSIKRKIKKIIREQNVILFDAHTFHCEGYAAYLLKRKYPKIKTLITFHGSDLEAVMKSKIEQSRVFRASKYIDSFICVSDKLKNKLKTLEIKNVKTVYNGINQFPLVNLNKDNTIISVGNLVESKKMGMLIDAFAIFNKLHGGYKLKIIGSGYLKNDLKRRIKEYNLGKQVFLLGQLTNENVYRELEKSKYFILPSSPEGFGIVYAEAMYCGCVTVGTKGEGIDGFIKDKKNGFLINSNVESVVKILEYITSNDCSDIISNAKSDAKKLTWDKNIKEYLNI